MPHAQKDGHEALDATEADGTEARPLQVPAHQTANNGGNSQVTLTVLSLLCDRHCAGRCGLQAHPMAPSPRAHPIPQPPEGSSSLPPSPETPWTLALDLPRPQLTLLVIKEEHPALRHPPGAPCPSAGACPPPKTGPALCVLPSMAIPETILPGSRGRHPKRTTSNTCRQEGPPSLP